MIGRTYHREIEIQDRPCAPPGRNFYSHARHQSAHFVAYVMAFECVANDVFNLLMDKLSRQLVYQISEHIVFVLEHCSVNHGVCQASINSSWSCSGTGQDFRGPIQAWWARATRAVGPNENFGLRQLEPSVHPQFVAGMSNDECSTTIRDDPLSRVFAMSFEIGC
jgi:hypothetical protein